MASYHSNDQPPVVRVWYCNNPTNNENKSRGFTTQKKADKGSPGYLAKTFTLPVLSSTAMTGRGNKEVAVNSNASVSMNSNKPQLRVEIHLTADEPHDSIDVMRSRYNTIIAMEWVDNNSVHIIREDGHPVTLRL